MRNHKFIVKLYSLLDQASVTQVLALITIKACT